MSRRVQHDLLYDARAADVRAMLADAAFREEVCVAIGTLRHTVTVTGNGEGMEVVIDQVLPAQGIPSFARKFVGDEIHIRQVETWHDPAGGAVEVTIPGKPGHMVGTVDLVESDGRTTERVDLEVKVTIPLVGGRIEGLIADILLKALKTENHVGREYLSR